MPSDSEPYRVILPSGHMLYPLCSGYCVSVAHGWTPEECLHRIFDGTKLGYAGGIYLVELDVMGRLRNPQLDTISLLSGT